MHYTPISPFRRPLSPAHLRVHDRTAPPAQTKPINKWDLFRDLSTAQAVFGINPRDLTVLQGLLSFFPDDALGGTAAMIVFPSNKALCERLNGMACSTMRRHLGHLVETGLLIRRDSPTGKRYIRKTGPEPVAFGLDLAPLHARAEEIARAAEAVRAACDRIRRLREVVSLMRRDAVALADYGRDLRPGFELWNTMRETAGDVVRGLRQKLTLAPLLEMHAGMAALLDRARDVIDGPGTEEMSTGHARSGQRHQNSEKESIESEPALETVDGTAVAPDVQAAEQELPSDKSGDGSAVRPLPRIPLHLVVASCPALGTFYQGEVRHWHQLFDAACHIRPAMGVSPVAWEEAQRCMGPEQASIVLVAMLERFAEIKSPTGYLRALTRKAAEGAFSCGPMIMALVSRRGSR